MQHLFHQVTLVGAPEVLSFQVLANIDCHGCNVECGNGPLDTDRDLGMVGCNGFEEGEGGQRGCLIG